MSVGEKLQKVAENLKEVYGRAYVGGFGQGWEEGREEGYREGISESYSAGYGNGMSDGIRMEYDRFWDANQDQGNRTNYQYAYVGNSFNFQNFYPKYDICPTSACNQSFALWNMTPERHKHSLKQRLQDCGVRLDTSRATSLLQAFFRSHFTELPVIVLPAGVSNKQIFGECIYLETVEKLVVAETTAFQDCFDGCASLKNVVFEGVIGQNGLDFSECPLLTAESMCSVIACLMPYSSGDHRVVFGTENLAKLAAIDKERAAQKGWILE